MWSISQKLYREPVNSTLYILLMFMPTLKSKAQVEIYLQKLLNEWLDRDKYGVWIDGKRVENSRLKNYKAADFGSYAVSRLKRNSKKYAKHV